MSPTLQRLRAEIASDVRAFEARVSQLASRDIAEAADEDRLALVAVALHHAYGALESALVRVAREIDGGVPEGPDWHSALLESMSLEIADVRPAVVSPETEILLRRLLGFRHFFRHAYNVEWDAERLDELRRKALALGPLIQEDFAQLDRFLAALG